MEVNWAGEEQEKEAGWLREHLIRTQVGNSSILRRIQQGVYIRVSQLSAGTTKPYLLSAAAAALDLDGEETEPTAVSPTAARGETQVWARCASYTCSVKCGGKRS